MKLSFLPAKRLAYLKSLYEVAINRRKPRTPGTPEQEEWNRKIGVWRQQVWELGQAEFPELNPRPDYYPTESWVVMPHPESGYTLHYKNPKNAPKSQADIELLELAHRGDDVELESEYAERLECAEPFDGNKITILKTTKFVTFRLEVSREQDPPAFDEASVRKALQAVLHLKHWWENAQH